MTDRHAIGGNSPPRHEAFAMALDDVRMEAGNFLDGSPITTQAQADAVGLIASSARKIRKDADAARKEDKEPHLTAGKAVDTNYKPVLETADGIISAAQKPLTTWLEAIEAQQRKEAEEARQAAHEAQMKALEQQRAADGDIEATEAAKATQKEADKLTKAASRAEKVKPQVAGEGRAIGLRTYHRALVTNHRALLEHVMKEDAQPLKEWLEQYAQKAMPRVLPGVENKEERKVV